MQPVAPFWFKQRQCKVEPAGNDNTVRVSGPNLGEAYLSICRDENQLWRAVLRLAVDGPEVSATRPELESPHEAWEAAFELYRSHLIV
jgi:hypothetical protein